jgi:hypothetical protein
MEDRCQSLEKGSQSKLESNNVDSRTYKQATYAHAATLMQSKYSQLHSTGETVK